MISAGYAPHFRAGLRPDSLLTVSAWSDRYRHLAQKSAAEPGRWRTSRTPYLAEIMDSLSSNSPVQTIVFMKAAQIGGSECGNNWIGYLIDQAPGPIMLVQPTVETAKRYSKQRLAPMLLDSPQLAGKVKEARERDSGNTMLAKEFAGGILILTGANSAVGLRSMPVRYLFLDEIDAYPGDVDGEGDPVSLALKRTTTFARRKVFLCSTPLVKATSRIEPAYLASDQRRYCVPCPFCGFRQWLKWAQFVFTFDGVKIPDQTMYRCESCEQLIEEHHKTAMLEAGTWVPTAPGNGTVGYHLSAFYSPVGWKSWADIVREFLAADGKQLLLKTWVNTVLGETWEEAGERPDDNQLLGQTETYEATVPEGVVVLTAAIDVQDDRLEAELVGWGVGEESWSIDYQRWMGSPAQQDVWTQLEAWLQLSWTHASGVGMKVQVACVDTGGHFTKEAYEFVRSRQGRRVYALKGSNQPAAPLVKVGSMINRVRLFLVGTDTAKDTLFSRLQLHEFGPGYCHFPKTPRYDAEYFQQLTAETKRSKYSKGVLIGYHYVKTRARNEALDLRIYNMAALAILNPNLAVLAEKQAASLAPVALPPTSTIPHAKPVRSGFVTKWKR